MAGRAYSIGKALKKAETVQTCPDCGEKMTMVKLLKHLKKDHGVGAGKNKYHARKVHYDGHIFASGLECRRYKELKILEAAGEISALQLQPAFHCFVNGKLITRYTADFKYRDGRTGKFVVEDTKGVRTEAYVVRRKLTEALFGIKVIEVR